MKRNKLFALVLVVLSVGVVGCLEEMEDMGPTISTVLTETSMLDDDYLFTTERGDKILVTQLPADYDFETEKLVYLSFSNLVKELEDERYGYTAKVERVDSITTKEIITIDEVNRDTLGVDGVYFNELLATKNYLNLYITFSASGSAPHYFDISYDADAQGLEAGHIDVTFHHDANGDGKLQDYSGLVSFDLRSINKELPRPLTITVHGKDMNAKDVEFEVKTLE